MNINEIKKILSPVEEVLLDGEKFTTERVYDHATHVKRLQVSVPGIVKAYDLFKLYLKENKIGSGEENRETLSKIFYLARDIEGDFYLRDLSETGSKEEGLIKRLHEIAKEGREMSLSNPKTVEDRIALAKLFFAGIDILAAQLQDPKRGCSASVCTNCDEPIAFCNYTCPACEYNLIGAHGMPTVEEWNNKDIQERLIGLAEGYTDMIRDIRSRGDWRGKNSPFNKFEYDFDEIESYARVVKNFSLRTSKILSEL